MYILKNAIMRQEDSRIFLAVVGVLTVYLAVLPAMGLFIAI
jgi:hypothetical protein